MKPRKGAAVSLSLVGGFTAWRLWEQGRLTRRFVAADVDPGDASIAAAQIIPFFSTVTYGQITNTIESSGLTAAQINQTYFDFAGDAWLIAQGNN